MSEQLKEIVHSDVIIVGGGPVGIALAIELGRHQINTIVLERYHEPLKLPKAMGLSARTMEFFRRWNVSEATRSASPLPKNYPLSLCWCTSLQGKVWAHIDPVSKEQFSEFSPETSLRLPLWITENVLRSRLKSLPTIDLILDKNVYKIKQDSAKVLAFAKDSRTGTVSQYQGKFLIGCDGGASLVRKEIQSELMDHEVYSSMLKLHFYSPDLDQKINLPKAILYSIYDKGKRGVFGPIDAKGHWYAQIPLKTPADADSINKEEELQRLAGFEFQCEIENFAVWTMEKAIAKSFSSNRIFLAGDAAHIPTPTGGHGLNTGMGDVMNLGWKLAAVINGWGGELLLNTYQEERQPVAIRNMNASGKNKALQSKVMKEHPPEKDPEGFQQAITKLAHLHAEGLGIDHGYRYEDSPIIINDGSLAPEDNFSRYLQIARPGHCAPHVWLNNGTCLFDGLGPEFTLLATDPALPTSTIETAAQELHIPLKVLKLHDSNLIMYKKLTLIRPDGHIAWHSDSPPADAHALLSITTGGGPSH